jgi:hypothetical protein
VIFLRVCYWVIAIILAVTGFWNSLELRSHRREIDGQHRRLSLIENVRDRIRDRVIRSDETATDAAETFNQDSIHSHLLDRIESLEQSLRDKGN